MNIFEMVGMFLVSGKKGRGEGITANMAHRRKKSTVVCGICTRGAGKSYPQSEQHSESKQSPDIDIYFLFLKT